MWLGGYLGDPVVSEEILIQPLWENHLIGNKKNEVWLQRGIQFLSDIVDENGDILAFENFKQKFRLEEHTNFLDYFSLIKSLPSKWKEIIKSQTQSKNTDSLITKLCSTEKAQRPSQVIYQKLRKSVAKGHKNAQRSGKLLTTLTWIHGRKSLSRHMTQSLKVN